VCEAAQNEINGDEGITGLIIPVGFLLPLLVADTIATLSGLCIGLLMRKACFVVLLYGGFKECPQLFPHDN